MAAKKVRRKRVKVGKPNYVISVLLISLALFILGLNGLIFLHFETLSNLTKSQVEVQLFLSDETGQLETVQLEKRLQVEPFTASTEYLTKEDAKKIFVDEMEMEDFGETLDINPLPASINLSLKPEYVNEDSLQKVKDILQVKYGREFMDINVNEQLVKDLDRGLGIMRWVLMALGILLLVVVVIIIDSTIRLAMYSNRFLLKNMQLVGAKRWFITRPYLNVAILNGLISSVLAIAGLVGVIYLAHKQFPDLEALQEPVTWGMLFLFLILMGLFISWWSTFRAVTKYLRTNLMELY